MLQPLQCIYLYPSNLHQACRSRKHCTCGCRSAKQSLIAMACDSKLHAITLWRVISVKLNIGKKITGSEK